MRNVSDCDLYSIERLLTSVTTMNTITIANAFMYYFFMTTSVLYKEFSLTYGSLIPLLHDSHR